MAQKIGKINVEQKLIETNSKSGQKIASVSTEDVVVESLSEKRYLWTARAFAIITALSICCNIVLLLAIAKILPLHRVEAFLLTFKNKQEQVYNIQAVQTSLEDEKAITEVFVRQYVLLRSTFDTDIPEMEARWLPGGPIQEMSADNVYNDFLNNTAKRAIDLIRVRNIKRDVRIITVNELSRGLWQVEYETQDVEPSSRTPKVTYWTASLNIGYRQKTVTYKERMKNPVGFTVLSYSLAQKRVN